MKKDLGARHTRDEELHEQIAKLRDEVINLRRMAAPDYETQTSLWGKTLVVIKWVLCLLVGIGLVSYFTIKLDADPFVLGTQTQEVETFAFPSVGVTPQSPINPEYYDKVNKFVMEVVVDKNVTSAQYRNWTQSATYKLALLLYQLCNLRETYLAKYGFTSSRIFLLEFLNPPTEVTDNPLDDELQKFVIPDMKKGITNCSQTITMVSWNNKIYHPNVTFREVFTDAGVSCIVNASPLHSSERNQTLKSALTKLESNAETKKWTNVNFDKFATSKEDSPVLRQTNPGEYSGLSFLVKENRKHIRCRVTDGDGFRLTLAHPRDLHNVRQYGKNLAYGFEHSVKITPASKSVDKDVEQTSQKARNCCLTNECVPNGQSEAYSQSHCLAICQTNFIYGMCNCTTVDSYGSSNRRLCNNRDYYCYIENLEIFYSQQSVNCSHCKPNCNNIRYTAEISSVPLSERVLDRFMETFGKKSTDFAVVHIFYGDVVYEATVMKLRRLFGEVIGITTGMLGSAVEITLPKICDFFLAIFGFLGAFWLLLWKKCFKCRQCCQRLLHRARKIFVHPKKQVRIPPIQISVLPSRNGVQNEHVL